ncbi:MAG: GNAT family N-acetyltransferase [Polyangiaceae bacterium]
MRSGPAVSIGALEPHLVDDAADLLARAFAENPAYASILSHLPNDERREALPLVKRALIRATMSVGRANGAWLGGDRLTGVSLVLGPGQYPWGLRGFFGLSFASLHASTYRAIPNFLRYDTWSKKRHIREPHYYLFVIGVDPKRQGKGVGRALLESLAKQADGDHVPCYLETDTKENVRLYRKHGYEVVNEDVLKMEEPLRMWTMLRPTR